MPTKHARYTIPDNIAPIVPTVSALLVLPSAPSTSPCVPAFRSIPPRHTVTATACCIYNTYNSCYIFYTNNNLAYISYSYYLPYLLQYSAHFIKAAISALHIAPIKSTIFTTPTPIITTKLTTFYCCIYILLMQYRFLFFFFLISFGPYIDQYKSFPHPNNPINPIKYPYNWLLFACYLQMCTPISLKYCHKYICIEATH